MCDGNNKYRDDTYYVKELQDVHKPEERAEPHQLHILKNSNIFLPEVFGLSHSHFLWAHDLLGDVNHLLPLGLGLLLQKEGEGKAKRWRNSRRMTGTADQQPTHWLAADHHDGPIQFLRPVKPSVVGSQRSRQPLTPHTVPLWWCVALNGNGRRLTMT